MPDGITILNSYEKLTNSSTIAGCLILGIWFFAALAIIIIMWCITKKTNWKEIVISIIFIILSCVCWFNIPEKAYITYYQVTIDDSVSINEVYDKYKIIDTEGEIYTIIEREDLK